MSGDLGLHYVAQHGSDSNDGINQPWSAIASPSTQPASIYLPASLSVKECVDVMTGSTVTTSQSGSVLSVPVADSPVAVRVGS